MQGNIPIIRLEVERMKQSILAALPQHAVAMDDAVRAAIEAYCTPSNIKAVVRKEVMLALDTAVKEEIRSFFQWSRPGRQAVREAVIAYLDEWDRTRSRADNGLA